MVRAAISANYGVLSGRTARACESCLKRRARWFCPADDAFLCHPCDSTVHSANELASRHNRVRVRLDDNNNTTTNSINEHASWHHGWFTRKARTPRSNFTKIKPPPPPSSSNNKNNKNIGTDDNNQDFQLRRRRPIPHRPALVPEMDNSNKAQLGSTYSMDDTDYYNNFDNTCSALTTTTTTVEEDHLAFSVPVLGTNFKLDIGIGEDLEADTSELIMSTIDIDHFVSHELDHHHHELPSINNLISSSAKEDYWDADLADFAAEVESLLVQVDHDQQLLPVDQINDCKNNNNLNMVDDDVEIDQLTSTNCMLKLEKHEYDDKYLLGDQIRGRSLTTTTTTTTGCCVEEEQEDDDQDASNWEYLEYSCLSPQPRPRSRSRSHHRQHQHQHHHHPPPPPPHLGFGFNSCDRQADDEINKHKHKHDQEIKKSRKLLLRLNYDGVISAWAEAADQYSSSPWTSGHRPPDFDRIVHHVFSNYNTMGGGGGGGGPTTSTGRLRHGGGGDEGGGHVDGSDGGRGARVMRYREKRKTRLFSKKIRYQVRKLNAEKRPRLKGRFVKRPAAASSTSTTKIKTKNKTFPIHPTNTNTTTTTTIGVGLGHNTTFQYPSYFKL